MSAIDARLGIVSSPTVRPYQEVRKGYTYFAEDDVLFAKITPCMQNGKHAIATNLIDGIGFGTTEFHVIRPGPEVTARWLHFFLRQDSVLTEAVAHFTGAVGQQRVPEGFLANLEIPVPSLDEQRRIVAMLDRQMALVERASRIARERQSLVDRFSNAALREGFHGIIPLCIDPKSVDGSPRGWRWVRLTDVARLESGHTPSRKHPEWWGGKIPWLALPDIRALHGRIATTTAEATNKAGIANSSARVLPKATVVLSRTASVGFVAVMGRPMATSQDFVNWVCGPELEPWFLVYLLMASRERLLSFASGAIHKTIYMPTVDGFHICLPPIEAQRAIVERVRARLARCGEVERAAKAETDSIEVMPRALLWHVFGKAA